MSELEIKDRTAKKSIAPTWKSRVFLGVICKETIKPPSQVPSLKLIAGCCF